MADKIRVMNMQKFDVGIVTQDKPNGLNIKPGSFAMLSQDDVDYIMTISALFQKGILRIEAPIEKEIMQAVGIDVDKDPNFIDNEEIKKKLAGTAKSIEKWLDTIQEEYVLDRIYDIAMDMNLNMSKIKVLQAKMPAKNFLDD